MKSNLSVLELAVFTHHWNHPNYQAFYPPLEAPSIDRLMVLYEALKTLKIIRSYPLHSCPKNLIKKCAHEISDPLTAIFIHGLKHRIFPSRWKVTIVIPLPEVKKVYGLGNFHSLSVTPDSGETLDGCLAQFGSAPIWKH